MGFLDLLAVIFTFIVVFLIILIIRIVLAKFFNANFIDRSGRVVVDPDTYDQFKNTIISAKEHTINKIKSRDYRITKLISESKSNKIEKLEKLGKLKQEGVINSDEFELLKKEIIEK